MPIDVHFDEPDLLLWVTLSGRPTLEELVRTVGEIVTDERFGPGFDVFSDHTAVEAALPVADAQRAARFLTALGPQLAGARWAAVTSLPASWGTLRMLAVHLEEIPVRLRVFPSEAEAMAWLRPARQSFGY